MRCLPPAQRRDGFFFFLVTVTSSFIPLYASRSPNVHLIVHDIYLPTIVISPLRVAVRCTLNRNVARWVSKAYCLCSRRYRSRAISPISKERGESPPSHVSCSCTDCQTRCRRICMVTQRRVWMCRAVGQRAKDDKVSTTLFIQRDDTSIRLSAC